jgi:uncharacterized membrane protein YhaH (DUF805 family)
MDPLALFLSSSGRLGSRPFAIAVILIYLAGIASQTLLSAAAVARAGLWPFALTQAMLIWAWYAVHAKRMRDAGHGTGGAAGIALIYTLAIVLLLLIVAFFLGVGRDAGDNVPPSNVVGFFVVLYLIGVLFSAADLGFFTVVITCLIAIALAPTAIAFGYSIYAGTRPSVAPSPLPLPPSAG